MSITALPPDTVRSLGTAQVLTDSSSVVKELIDNSLDACASAIFVELAVNSLDVVQVKDNGHGIAPNDRAMLCRRHYTSKIRSFEDLKTIGGNSLGFRGEALAGAAAMSGSLIVSTRIPGEATAVSLTISCRGQIEKEERTSQPVGTTVRILDFLKDIPVRRQTALKTSAKSIAKVKRLLQSYAFAWPSVRFSLKVLKAKNTQSDWIYAPTREPTTLDTAMKIVGKRIVDQCESKVWISSLEDNPSNAQVETSGKSLGSSYKFDALLPTPSCDASIVSNTGQYLSIDSRPVSCNRGTLKQIINIYKSYLRSGSFVENVNEFKNPFLSMNITCPSGSYDPNVEPAKDDVIFCNADFVISIFEKFLKGVYGELQAAKGASLSRLLVPKPRGFDAPLTTNPPPSAHEDMSGQVNVNGAFRGNGNDLDVSLADGRQPQGSPGFEEEDALRDIRISNPWYFAKINASVRKSNTGNQVESTVERNDQLLTPGREVGAFTEARRQQLQSKQQEWRTPKSGLPTPTRTQGDYATPFRAQSSPAHSLFSFPRKTWGGSDENASRKHGTPQRVGNTSGSFNSWVAINRPRDDSFDHETQHGSSPAKSNGRDFVSARTLPLVNHFDNIPDLGAQPTRRCAPEKTQGSILNKPSISPERVRRDSEFGRRETITPNHSDSDTLSNSSPVRSVLSVHPDLAASMDYENRKQAALQQYKASQRRKPLTGGPITNALEENPDPQNVTSPHKNRQNKAIAALHFAGNDHGKKSNLQSAVFGPGDPRAYLIRSLQQDKANDSSGRPRNRRKTGLLPLETMQEDSTMRDLTLAINTKKLDAKTLLGASRVGGKFRDEYISSGKFTDAFSFSTNLQMQAWEPRIRKLMANMYGEEIAGEEERADFWLDLRTALQKHRNSINS